MRGISVWIARAVALIVFCSALLTSGLGCEQKTSPKLKAEQKSYDFGQVHQGKDVEGKFSIKNTGQETLNIKNVAVSCGCLTVSSHPDSLVPGESGTLRLSLSTDGESGPIAKHLFLSTNDPENPKVEFTLRGSVIEMVSFKPATCDFGRVKMGKPQTKRVLVQAKEKGRTVKIVRVSIKPDFIEAQITGPKQLVSGNRTSSLEITLTGEAPAGRITERVAIKTDLANGSVFHLPVFAEVLGPVRVEPRIVALGPGQNRQADPVIDLYARTEQEFQVTEVKTNIEQFEVLVQTITPGKHYQVALRVPSVKEPQPVNGVVRIHTDVEKQAEITVLVSGALGDFGEAFSQSANQTEGTAQ